MSKSYAQRKEEVKRILITEEREKDKVYIAAFSVGAFVLGAIFYGVAHYLIFTT